MPFNGDISYVPSVGWKEEMSYFTGWLTICHSPLRLQASTVSDYDAILECIVWREGLIDFFDFVILKMKFYKALLDSFFDTSAASNGCFVAYITLPLAWRCPMQIMSDIIVF